MKIIISYIIAAILITSQLASAQQIAKTETGSFLLRGGTLVTVSNGTITGDLLVADGKIKSIGESIPLPAGAIEIDCAGKYVYPGMIDGGTKLGLQEVGSVSLTSDHNEIGDFIPHMEALTAVNPNAVSIPVTRVNGITSALVVPSGGSFPGTASLINLVGYTPDQMYAGFKGAVLNFPATGKRGWWDRRSAEDIKKEAEKAMKTLDDTWKKVKLYAKINAAASSDKKALAGYNPSMDAMLQVANGTRHLLVEVNKEADIKAALKWIEKNEVNAILTGVSEGYRVAADIAKADLPVIVGPVLSIPGRQSDKYDAAYTNPGLLHKAGVKVVLRTSSYENVRNLPYNAGFAAAYGMGTEAALRSVTLSAAEVFGVAGQLGSLDEGKIANLFVSDGDPFETKTDIYHLFISGRKVPLESRHTLLYDEFLNRDPGLKK